MGIPKNLLPRPEEVGVKRYLRNGRVSYGPYDRSNKSLSYENFIVVKYMLDRFLHIFLTRLSGLYKIWGHFLTLLTILSSFSHRIWCWTRSFGHPNHVLDTFPMIFRQNLMWISWIWRKVSWAFIPIWQGIFGPCRKMDLGRVKISG